MGLTVLWCVLLDQVKCAQYWPQREEREAVFEDTNFKLTLISEDVKSYYTVRQLELENLSVSNFAVLAGFFLNEAFIKSKTLAFIIQIRYTLVIET